MIVFEKFAITPGIVLDARVGRGMLHALVLEADDWQDAFLDSYLADLSGGAEEGDILLEEVRDAAGRPRRLRELPVDMVRGYFAQFVGFVLRDGGLIDSLTVRENLLLPFRYAEVWPRRTPVTDAEIGIRLHNVLGFAGAPDLSTWLDHHPPALSLAQRRLTGLVRACIRHPELLIVFAPFAGLDEAARRVWWDCLQHYRAAFPRSAHLLVLNRRDELAGLPGAAEVAMLTPTFSPFPKT